MSKSVLTNKGMKTNLTTQENVPILHEASIGTATMLGITIKPSQLNKLIQISRECQSREPCQDKTCIGHDGISAAHLSFTFTPFHTLSHPMCLSPLRPGASDHVIHGVPHEVVQVRDQLRASQGAPSPGMDGARGVRVPRRTRSGRRVGGPRAQKYHRC